MQAGNSMVERIVASLKKQEISGYWHAGMLI